MLYNLINDLHVPLWQWVLSQAIGVFLVATLVIGFQQKRKQRVLLAFAIANALGVVSMILLENYGLAALSAVNVAKNLVFMWTNKEGVKLSQFLSYSILIFFLIATVVSVWLTWVTWTDWPIMGFQLFTTWASWSTAKYTTHVMKASSVGFQTFFVINAIIFFNIIGIVASALILSSIFAFYIKFFLKRGKEVKESVEEVSVQQNTCDADRIA